MFIRHVFHLPLRQTEGFMNSLVRVMKANIAIPDFSSISKHVIGLPRHVLNMAMEPSSLVIVDSSGLKVYGKDEWYREKHGIPAWRTWRKLHLAINEYHRVLACELTTPEIGDNTAVPDLLVQVATPFDAFMDDGEPVLEAVRDKQDDVKIVIPPHKTAALPAAGDTQRDRHIQTNSQQGRTAWQWITGYNLRNYVELAMQRYKRIFGNPMEARVLAQQKTAAGISASAGNRMTNRGRPGVRENLELAKTRGNSTQLRFIQQRHLHIRLARNAKYPPCIVKYQQPVAAILDLSRYYTMGDKPS